MKASPWSLNPSVPCAPVTFTVVHAGGHLVQITLRCDNQNGSFKRLRIVMTEREAAELAATLSTAQAKIVPAI